MSFKSLLVLKASSLGDIAQTLPALQRIHLHYPSLVIDWVVEAPFKGFLERVSFIRKLHVIDSKKWRKTPFQSKKERAVFIEELRKEEYDLTLDFQGNIKSSWVLFHTRSKVKGGFSFFTAPEKINCLFTNIKVSPPKGKKRGEDYLFLAESFFPLIKNETFSPPLLLSLKEGEEEIIAFWDKEISSLEGALKVVIAPFSNWKNKEIEVSVLADLLISLIEEKTAKFLIAWGSLPEKERGEKLLEILSKRGYEKSALLLDKQPLAVLQHLFTKVDLILTMDSLPLHLAALAKVRAFAFFGPSSGKVYSPKEGNIDYFQGECPYGITFTKRCSYLRSCPTGACLREVSPKTLFTALKKKE